MEFAERTALVIEDDADIRLLLETVLTQGGFTVHSAATGAEGVRLAKEVGPLVITLDVNLPDIDGFEVARRVRTSSDAYIVMLTARADEIDTLSGLDTGADDYVTKPFRPRELRARIEAMLRRPRVGATSAAPGEQHRGVAVAASPVDAHPHLPHLPQTIDPPAAVPTAVTHPRPTGIAGLVVDIDARTVSVDGADVALTRSEFELLAALWGSAGKVVTKHTLVRALWGDTYDVGTLVTPSDHRSVEVHMANLRRKIGEDSTAPRWIGTVRGVGYRLNLPRS